MKWVRKIRKFSNCLVFALMLYYRRRRKGKKGFVISRQSKYYKGPHFMYARMRENKTAQLVGFVPKYPKQRTFPPPFFEGKIVWGDDPNTL